MNVGRFRSWVLFAKNFATMVGYNRRRF
jgi:hypothetical protein